MLARCWLVENEGTGSKDGDGASKETALRLHS